MKSAEPIYDGKALETTEIVLDGSRQPSSEKIIYSCQHYLCIAEIDWRITLGEIKGKINATHTYHNPDSNTCVFEYHDKQGRIIVRVWCDFTSGKIMAVEISRNGGPFVDPRTLP